MPTDDGVNKFGAQFVAADDGGGGTHSKPWRLQPAITPRIRRDIRSCGNRPKVHGERVAASSARAAEDKTHRALVFVCPEEADACAEHCNASATS